MTVAADAGELTAGELIRLTFPPGCEIVTGAGERTRPVKWVALSGEAVPLAAGDVALAADPPPPALSARWQATGVVGVGIAGPAAELAAMPWPPGLLVLALPPGTALRAVQQSALRLLMDREAYLTGHAAQVQRDLARHALEGGGLPAMTRTMLDLTGHSVVVHDKRLAPLAHALAPALAGAWPEILAWLADHAHLPGDLRDRKRASGPQVQTLPGELARVICPVVVKGMARGYLSVVALAGELDALDWLVAEQGAAACALEMARAKAVSETTKRLRGGFVDALLQGALSEAEAWAWADRVGQDPDRPHALVLWAWGAGAGVSLRRLETAVNGEVARLGLAPLALVRPHGDLILAACEESGPPAGGAPAGPAAANAMRLARAALAALGQEYPRARAFAGVGRPAADLAGWRAAFREAEQALAIARRLESEAPLYFADLSVYRLLLQLEGHPELAAFTRDTLGPLLEYEGSADLLVTLAAFFKHHGNLSQTAGALYLHRNTLLYRMDRIAELGLDLSNPEIRLAAQLALKALRLLQPT